MPGDGSCLYYARRAWFAPVGRRPWGRRETGGGAGYCPRVRNAYFTSRVSP